MNNHVDTVELFNETDTVYKIMDYVPNETVCRQTTDKYHSYKLLGLNTDRSGNVQYCFGQRIYLENDITLYGVWQDIYAQAVGDVSNNLRLRNGAGTGYTQIASIAQGDPVVLKSFSSRIWNSGDSHWWYPVVYGSQTGWAAGSDNKNTELNNLRLTSLPNANSCNYAYSCASNNKLLSITPSSFTLNVTSNTSKQRLTQNLTINNQCGPITEVTSSDSNVVTATTAGVVTGKVNSISENTTKNVTITYKTKYDCTESVTAIVKNSQANPPTVTISISGNSSTCSGSYLSGATATVRCTSDVPITSYSAKIGSTSYSVSTSSDGKVKTSTIKLSSTGGKTINASCGNSEGSNSTSKYVSIKVYSSTSSCGCGSYYTASSAGSTCSRCNSWSTFVSTTTNSSSKLSNHCAASNGTQYKYTYSNWTYDDVKNRYNAKYVVYKCSSFACRSYKSCCHT